MSLHRDFIFSKYLGFSKVVFQVLVTFQGQTQSPATLHPSRAQSEDNACADGSASTQRSPLASCSQGPLPLQELKPYLPSIQPVVQHASELRLCELVPTPAWAANNFPSYILILPENESYPFPVSIEPRGSGNHSLWFSYLLADQFLCTSVLSIGFARNWVTSMGG